MTVAGGPEKAGQKAASGVPLRHRLFIALVLVVMAATMWPGYLPAARIEPYVFGLPFGLVWLVACIAVVFAALWFTFRADMRQGRERRDD